MNVKVHFPPQIHLPYDPSIHPMCLLTDPASHIDSIKNLVRSSTLPPVNTTTRARTRTSTRPVTQSMSTASLGVNPTHKTDTPRSLRGGWVVGLDSLIPCPGPERMWGVRDEAQEQT